MREDIESSRRGESSDIQEEAGLQYCRSMFQRRSLAKSGGATSLSGRSVQKTRTRNACMHLRYILERKNTFLGYKKQEVQKVIKLIFFQRG